MSVSNKLRMILMEYENKRNNAEYLAEERKRNLYEEIPELKYIEDKIKETGMLAVKRALYKGEDSNALKEEIKATFEKLTARKKEIYQEYGIHPDYLIVKYECDICNDKGILPMGGRCKCVEQRIIETLYDKSNMKNLIVRENFDTLNKGLYSMEPNSGGSGITQRELMDKNIEYAQKFIDEIGNTESLNLLFYGSTGTGKTFLSSCIAERVMRKGYTVMYKPCSELMQLATRLQFQKFDEESSKEYDNLYSCDLLIIDDLGTEMKSSFFAGELYKLINSRMVAGKKFIISSNYGPDKIEERYTSRVYYRLLESSRMLPFRGNNIRVEKLKKY